MVRKIIKTGYFGFFAFLWATVINLAPGLAHAQTFDRLFADSPTLALARPLQWLAVPKGSVNTPAELPPTAQADFKPYTDDTVLPTSDEQEVWATFTLPPTDPVQLWFIRIPRQTVYRVTLFSRTPQGLWEQQSAGEAIAPADWTLRTRVPSFELQTRSELSRTYFLRFEHRRPITERPMLLSPIEYLDGASRVGVVIGLMWGMFSLLAVLCLAAFIMARNTVFLWFGAVVVTLMFTQLVLIGYGGWRMWPYSAHLNQLMGWALSTLTLAAGAWFCAQATYAATDHPRIYRLLVAVTAGNLLMTGLQVFDLSLVSTDLCNLWMAWSTLVILASLSWMSWRGLAWNRLMLLGAAPITVATLARLAYNADLVPNVEVAQTAGVLSAMLGLLWIFLVLAWRSRAALFSNQRSNALANYDPASGLMLPKVIDSRLPQILLRARRQRLACGVLMLRWVDRSPSHDDASDEKRSASLLRLGNILRSAARDVDTVVRYDENHFMVLIEGPTNRETLVEMSTKILAACIRASDSLGKSAAFNLHVAIWHETPEDHTVQHVLETLKTRLHQMAADTRRPVQFVDSSTDLQSIPPEELTRREDLLAKINAVEISQPPLASAPRPERRT